MRFKSILGAFIFLLISSSVAMVFFIQTKSFGRVATKLITDLSQKKAQTKVKIKSVGFSIFPPGIELNQVKLTKKIGEGKKVKAEFGRLGFYVKLIELEEMAITLGEVKISHSTIDFLSPEEDEKDEIQEIDQKIINTVFKESEKLPVRIDSLIMENTKIFTGHDLVDVKKLKVSKRGRIFITRFHLANLKPLKDQDILIDEVWGDAKISRKDITIQRLKVHHDVHNLLVKGKIKNFGLLKKADFSLAGEAAIHINNLKDTHLLPEIIDLKEGFAHLSFKVESLNKQINGNMEVQVSNLASSILDAEKIISSLQMQNNILKINKFSMKNGRESAKLLSPQELYDFNSEKMLYRPLPLRVEHLSLNNILKFLPSMSVLKGELSGDVVFNYDNSKMEFLPKNGFLAEGLKLVVGEDKPFTILSVAKAKLKSAKFQIIKDEFLMDSVVELKNSLLDIHGSVGNGRTDFKVKNASIDLEDFGNISQLDIKGAGKLDITVTGPLSDTIINLKGKTKGFEVLGYKLGQADKDISVSLGDSSVIIHRFESLFRSTPISGTGVINYGNDDIALGLNSTSTNYYDLKEILKPVFSKISFLPDDLEFNAKIDADIFGKTSKDRLKIKSDVVFSDLLAYGETINSGSFKVALLNQILGINNLSSKKAKGQINGNFVFNLKTDKLKLDYTWKDLVLSSFTFTKMLKLNMNGKISGSIAGEGHKDEYLLKLTSKMVETKSPDANFENSNLALNITPSNVSGVASFFGNVINSEFDYSLIPSKDSKVYLKVHAPDVKPFATAFLGQHLANENFSGSVRFNLNAGFRGEYENVNLLGTVDELAFRHESFNVNYRSSSPQFIIEKGLIKRWDLQINEPDLHVKTAAKGRFGDDVILTNEVDFNSKIFEVLFSQVLSAEGFVRNMAQIEGQSGQYRFTANSRSTDLNVTLEDVPFPLNHLSYSIHYGNRRLSIDELKTTLDNGSLVLRGDVFFDDQNPDVNIKYILEKAEFPILGKSQMNLSGEGIILGNKPPYNVSGEIIVNKAQIVNELNDLSPKASALSQIRFLPPSQESPFEKLINLNVNVKLDNPARISNSLMDVSLKGEVMLIGSPTRPRGEGHLFSPPNSSKIFFKNNEYLITHADINFSPRKDIANPDFDVQATTLIALYKVNTKAYGDLERFNFDLTSDPNLPRNSILSLIAFGYTDDLQNSLAPKDQQNLTSVGVGSFVFDRFKISDILNKQFGLQVNLGTVLEQSQTDSLLSGRNGEGQSTFGRTRSATKIELKKRLDEAMSLSVSSTMGGSIGSRQSMNLNYGVSKKVQLEGVYELRTQDEGQADVIDNSIGGDLKFRWTFK